MYITTNCYAPLATDDYTHELIEYHTNNITNIEVNQLTKIKLLPQ